jgi:hypothetical protein
MVKTGAVADPVNVTADTLAVLAAAEIVGDVAKPRTTKTVTIPMRRDDLTGTDYSGWAPIGNEVGAAKPVLRRSASPQMPLARAKPPEPQRLHAQSRCRRGVCNHKHTGDASSAVWRLEFTA